MYSYKKNDIWRKERDREATKSAGKEGSRKRSVQVKLGHCMLLFYPLEFTTEQSSTYQKKAYLQSMGVGLGPQSKAFFPSPVGTYCRYGFQIEFILKSRRVTLW